MVGGTSYTPVPTHPVVSLLWCSHSHFFHLSFISLLVPILFSHISVTAPSHRHFLLPSFPPYFSGKVSSPPNDDPFCHRQHFSPSTWIPLVGLLSSLNICISNCLRDINCLNFFTRLTHFNLTPSECRALCSLSNNPNIVIKPADNGGAIVIWQADLYHPEARCQLSL